MNKNEIVTKIKEHKKKVAICIVALLLIGGTSVYAISNNSNGTTSKDKEQTEISTKGNDKENTSTDSGNSDSSQGNDDEKKDTSNSADDTSNGGSSNNGSSSNDKPSGGGSDKPADKPSNGGGSSSSGGSSKPSTPEHTHSWVAVNKTVNHKEEGHYETVVVTPAWTENIPIWGQDERSVCNQCGKDITGGESAHNKAHAMAGEPGGWHSEWVDIQIGTDTVNHPAVTKQQWVVDRAAWTETVLDYYKCSCGATK